MLEVEIEIYCEKEDIEYQFFIKCEIDIDYDDKPYFYEYYPVNEKKKFEYFIELLGEKSIEELIWDQVDKHY